MHTDKLLLRFKLPRKEYDFIVVGGGTAGSVVANRLSENENWNVLVLEAGGPESKESQIPALAQYLQLGDMDWKYQTEPSTTSCLAMLENRCNLPRGKALGGSSSINYMLYVRGNKNDYDLWEYQGNRGWSFKDMLPFFKKSEDNLDPEIAENSEFHGKGGPQKIQKGPWNTRLANVFLEAGVEMGYSEVDVNGPSQLGFMIPQGYTHKGSRYSAAKSFIYPIKYRKNIHIVLNAYATKVLFDQSTRAVGVQFESNNILHTVKCRKEVILSAGAFGSPQLLMLSGVGPLEHLKNIGIEVNVELPVGRNLQDHVAGLLSFTIDKSMSLKQSRLISVPSLMRYIATGSGPLTTFGGVEGIAFINTKYMNRSKDWADIELHFVSGSPASDSGHHIAHTLNLKQEMWTDYFLPLNKIDSFSVIFKLMRPRSRGFVELKSNNPKDKVKVTTNYLSEPFDMLVLMDGLHLVLNLTKQPAFEKIGTKLYDQPLPGCKHIPFATDLYWRCHLRHLTMTIYHYSGTCKMGPYWDADAVVDSSLRVYGTSGLRVVDASIFPNIPSGNTNAAVLMVAEKACSMIKEYWNEPPPTNGPASSQTQSNSTNGNSSEESKVHLEEL